MEEFEGWMRIGEAAKALMVSSQRLAQLIEQGRLEVKPTPYGRLVSEKSVQEYDKARREFLWAEPQRIAREEKAAV